MDSHSGKGQLSLYQMIDDPSRSYQHVAAVLEGLKRGAITPEQLLKKGNKGFSAIELIKQYPEYSSLLLKILQTKSDKLNQCFSELSLLKK